MRLVILSPSIHSETTRKLLEHLQQRTEFQVVGIVYRRIVDVTRFKEQLILGLPAVFFKLVRKALIPKLKSLFAIDAKINQHDIFFTDNFNAPKTVDQINSLNADLLVFTGGGLLRKEILNSSRLGVLNCHSGILPKYRGMFPHIWAINNDDFENIGCTTHFMDEGIDTGPIVAKFYLAAHEHRFDKLADTLEKMIPRCLMDSLDQITNKGFLPESQRKEDGMLYKVPNSSTTRNAKKKFEKFNSDAR